jgi:hypothetical protein
MALLPLVPPNAVGVEYSSGMFDPCSALLYQSR